MDWWTGMNPCSAMGGPTAAAAVAAAASVDAAAATLFDPWINYDDIDLGTILNQPHQAATSSTSAPPLGSASPTAKQVQVAAPGQLQLPAAPQGPFSGAHSDTNTSDTSSNNGPLQMVYSFPHHAAEICSPPASSHLEEVTASVEQQQHQLLCSPGQHEDSKHNLFDVITNHFNTANHHPQFQDQLQHQNHHHHHQHLQQHNQRHHHQHQQPPNTHLQQSSKCSSTGPSSSMSSSSSMELSPQQHQHQHRHQLSSYMADSPSSPLAKQNAPIMQPNVASLLMIDPADNQIDSSQHEQQHNYAPAQSEHLHHHHHQHNHHVDNPQPAPHIARQMLLSGGQQQQLAKQTSVSTPTNSNSSKQANQKVRRCRHITDYVLADEEKRLLIKEGYNDFPMNCQTRPLSKSEERILRKIRRKIRNKKSAQCSRQRKKEYVEDLERKYAAVVRENEELKQVIESIEQLQNNHNLSHHHQHYQHNHSHQTTTTTTSSSTTSSSSALSSSSLLTLEWKDLFGGGGGSGKMVRPPSPVKESSGPLEIQ